jgi:hypothetical protein
MDEGATDLEREVLRSWDAVRPSAEARRNTLALAGFGAVAAAASAAGAGSAATAIAPKATALALSAMTKAILLGALAGAATFAALDWGGALSPPQRMSSGAASMPIAASSASARVSLPSVSSSPTEPRGHSPIEPDPSAAPAPPRAPAAKEPPDEPSSSAPDPSIEAAPVGKPSSSADLGAQVALLDRARAALSSGDATSALGLLDRYDAEYPSGILSQEAVVLRVDALLRMGRREAGKRLGESFLAAHPKSPHGERIRQLLPQALPE